MALLSRQDLEQLQAGARVEVANVKTQSYGFRAFGKCQNPVNQVGHHHGEKGDQAGILNVQP